MARVCVLNYGSGNARSVFNLFRTEGAEWWKQNLWGVPSAYGPVHLPASARARYQRRERMSKI